jgi:hypothetical protein
MNYEIMTIYNEGSSVGPIFKGTLKKSNSSWSDAERNDFKNVAILQANYNLLVFLFPSTSSVWTNLMSQSGLVADPNNLNTDTPYGLGNVVWQKTFQDYAVKDGINAIDNTYGCDSGGKNTCFRTSTRSTIFSNSFKDYTNYTSINIPFPAPLLDPDRWQPHSTMVVGDPTPGPETQAIRDLRLWHRSENFITPQFSRYIPSLVDIDTIDNSLTKKWKPPTMTAESQPSLSLYTSKVNEVLNVSANLNDTTKMLAEYFDNKLKSYGLLGGLAVARVFGPSDIDSYLIYEFYVNDVLNAAMASVWKYKAIIDAVRPRSAIRWLYLENPTYGSGGAYSKSSYLTKVYNDLYNKRLAPIKYPEDNLPTHPFPASQWNSYIPTDSHPEYPSGTSCYGVVWSLATSLFLSRGSSTDYTLHITVSFPAGSSVREPSITPSSNLVINFNTMSEIGQISGDSRLWGGVHFREAIEESRRVCGVNNNPIPIMAYRNLQKMLSGDLSWKTW